MDYECDVGYLRSDSGKCVKDESFKEQRKSAQGLDPDQQTMCDAYGYYFVTQGYRKIPGNRCSGGLDLNQYKYTCGYGYLQPIRTLILLITFGVATYFAYPFMLKHGALTLKQMTSTAGKPGNTKKSYSGNLSQAPECLGESDDEDNDVGSQRRPSGAASGAT